jgi:hypothetical protein
MSNKLLAAATANNTPQECGDLRALIGVSNAQSGKTIDPTVASAIVTYASLGETDLGC